jgi:hypothetical protein
VDVAYVISAYKLPSQAARLIHRLVSPKASFVVHVDRKAPAEVHRTLARAVDGVERLTFLPPHRCHWGGFGHVRVTLKAIDHLLREDVPFEYVVLLTAQDYPLRSAAAIESTLAHAGGASYMSSWPLPHAGWSGRGGLDRFERRHVVGPRRVHLTLGRQAVPEGLVVRGGSPYWCLARPAVEEVADLVRRRPDVVRFFEHVYIPDELFFQTALATSPQAASIVDDNLRYVDWTSTPAPKILTVDDLPRLLASDALFARKFDETVDRAVLDRLDEHATALAAHR